jgi:serine/threonine protein kinase
MSGNSEEAPILDRFETRQQASGTHETAGRLGDFRIIREIGRGGMAVVYEAEQESLARHVAIKVLPQSSLTTPLSLERFLREARTAAQLHHAHIVPVFGVGQCQGFYYIAMRLIEGVGLDKLLAQLVPPGASPPIATTVKAPTPQTTLQAPPIITAKRVEATSDASPIGGLPPPGPAYWRRIAQIGVQVADALHYAHQRGMLHRDIKPANLLVDRQGIVWVTDFGLAKAVEHDDVSKTGDIVGTLRYMAPERFQGKADAQSDVYSLGLTLYEMLTFRPAYEPSTPSVLIGRITEGQPLRPRAVNAAIPRDLETIVLKSIAKDPSHRYASAGELADDLGRFLGDRPICARRLGLGERLWRWARRNRAVASMVGLAVALLILVAAVASIGYVQTHRASVEVREALVRESQQRRKAEDALARESQQRKKAEDALGRESLRRKNAEDALAGKTQQAQRAEAVSKLTFEAADDRFDLSQTWPVWKSLFQKSLAGSQADREQAAEAMALLEATMKDLNAQLQSDSEAVYARDILARCYKNLADIFTMLGDDKQAEQMRRRARPLRHAR